MAAFFFACLEVISQYIFNPPPRQPKSRSWQGEERLERCTMYILSKFSLLWEDSIKPLDGEVSELLDSLGEASSVASVVHRKSSLDLLPKLPGLKGNGQVGEGLCLISHKSNLLIVISSLTAPRSREGTASKTKPGKNSSLCYRSTLRRLPINYSFY